jgi:hypothetical protein
MERNFQPGIHRERTWSSWRRLPELEFTEKTSPLEIHGEDLPTWNSWRGLPNLEFMENTS